jgi:hypothetical protein
MPNPVHSSLPHTKILSILRNPVNPVHFSPQTKKASSGENNRELAFQPQQQVISCSE